MSRSVEVFDVKRANELLKHAIGTLQGQNVIATPRRRLQVVFAIKEELVEMGAWWQTRTLNYWIHRARGFV